MVAQSRVQVAIVVVGAVSFQLRQPSREDGIVEGTGLRGVRHEIATDRGPLDKRLKGQAMRFLAWPHDPLPMRIPD